MLWEYTSPPGKVAWADGKKSYLYTPEDRQVLIQPLDESLPVRLLMGTADLAKECRCQGVRTLGGELEISLDMADASQGIRNLTVRVEERRGVVTSLAYQDPLGNQIAFAFTEIQVDVPVPESAFKVAIPRGARVIENP